MTARVCGTALLLCLLAAGAAAGAEAVGVITALEGPVSIRRADGTVVTAAKLKDEVRADDTIETGGGAKVKILFGEDLLVVVGPDSIAEMKRHAPGPRGRLKSAVIFLKRGALRSILDTFAAGDTTFNVETYNSVAGVVGTDFVVEYSEASRTTVVSVLQGEVELRSRFVEGRSRLTRNTFAEVSGEKGAPTPPRAIDAARAERLGELALADQLNGRPKSPPERSRLGAGSRNPQAELVNNPQVQVVGQEPIFIGGPFGSPAKPAGGVVPPPGPPPPDTTNRENRLKDFLGGRR